MAWRPITREMYDAMLAAFRERPGNYSHAAEAAKCNWRMAKHGWLKGWATAKGPTWAKPLYQVIKDEEEAARIEAYRRQETERKARDADRDIVKKEAIDRRADMLQVHRACRGTLKVSIGVTQRILTAAMKVMDTLPNDEAVLADMHPAQKLKFGREAVRIASDVMGAARDMNEMARLEENKPTEIIQVETDMTMEQAVREIESAKSLLDLARRQGLISDGNDEQQDQGLGEPDDASEGPLH